MNINSVEATLVRYHVLHLFIGAIFAFIMFLIPKNIGIAASAVLVALVLPSAVLPEFTKSKWLDRGAVLAGAIIVGLIFYGLGKL